MNKTDSDDSVHRSSFIAHRSVTGFFTDSTLCIGCKACEVACKEWNDVPHDGFNWSGNSYDNTGALGHSTWRHVKFVEQFPEDPRAGTGRCWCLTRSPAVGAFVWVARTCARR